MQPRSTAAHPGPSRRAHPAVELLEERLPISENFGTLLAVSSLARAAEALLAHSTPPTHLAEVDTASAPASHVMPANAAWPNGLTITENVALAAAPRSSTPENAASFASPLLLDSLFAALPDDGLEANGTASAATSGGTSAEPGAHASGDLTGFSVAAAAGIAGPPGAYISASGPSGVAGAGVFGSTGPYQTEAPSPGHPSTDQQWLQTLRFVPAGLPASGGASLTRTPSPSSSSALSHSGASSPSGGIQPFAGPFMVTLPGGDGVVPNMEFG
jgi:hypothetical protein